MRGSLAKMLNLLMLVCSLQTVLSANKTIDYLKRFGYLNTTTDSLTINIADSADSIDNIIQIQQGLTLFQTYYNLPIDGVLNEKTANLINTPRCGMPDYPHTNQQSVRTKWTKRYLSWSFPSATNDMLRAAAQAFLIWSNVTNLDFKYTFDKPDIVISFQKLSHNNSENCIKHKCYYDFDGSGGILGHAYSPRFNDSCTEIHADGSEVWHNNSNEKTPDGSFSLLAFLIHEIGHALGLGHSSSPEDIMYAYYTGRTGLSENDTNIIQSIYGVKNTSVNTAAPTTTTTDDTSSFRNTKYPDLCSIKPERYLITKNQHLYIFYKEFVWLMRLGEKTYRRPERISNYIPFNSFSHLYQRRNGEIALISDKHIHFIEFPSLRVLPRSYSIEDYIKRQNITINGFFTGYTGETYLLYDNIFYVEIDECNMQILQFGYISERFPGIPEGIESVFRYTNGNLYFFKNGNYYEFSEFHKKLVKAGPFDLSLFDINCPTEQILKQIRDLLSKLTTPQ